MRILFALFLLTGAVQVSAQELLTITPTVIHSSGQLEQNLAESKGSASQVLEGQGSRLHVTYTSQAPFDVYVIPLNKDGTYNPIDIITFQMPETDGERLSIEADLSVSPSWSLTKDRYQLYFLSSEEEAAAEFFDMSFAGPGPVELLKIMTRHFVLPEPYLPSSYHVLRGYRVLNGSFAVIFGIIAVGGALAFGVLRKNPRAGLHLLLTAALFFQARFSLDLLRFTNEHLRSWYGDGTYDEARNIYAVADKVTQEAAASPAPVMVYSCRDGTNFREKLLRYFAYPVPVISRPLTEEDRPSHALVMSRDEWSYDGTVLTCGDITVPATLLEDFGDDSYLFALLWNS